MASRTTSSAVLARNLFEAMGQLRRGTRRAVGTPWPAADLTGSQIELLRLVRRQPGVSVAAAAADLGLAPNTVSTLVRQLTDLGLLNRASDSRDRRIGRLALTDAARLRLEGWRDLRVAVLGAALDRLEPTDRETLDTAALLLARLADAVRQVPV